MSNLLELIVRFVCPVLGVDKWSGLSLMFHTDMLNQSAPAVTVPFNSVVSVRETFVDNLLSQSTYHHNLLITRPGFHDRTEPLLMM